MTPADDTPQWTGPVDERTKTRARYRAIYHAALVADYGLRIADAALQRAGTAALERMRVSMV